MPKFTERQIEEIMYDGATYIGGDRDDPNAEVYTTMEKKIISNDSEKNSVERRFVIKEKSTGKFFSAVLGESPWYQQMKYNAKQPWKEVFAKKVTITKYE